MSFINSHRIQNAPLFVLFAKLESFFVFFIVRWLPHARDHKCAADADFWRFPCSGQYLNPDQILRILCYMGRQDIVISNLQILLECTPNRGMLDREGCPYVRTGPRTIAYLHVSYVAVCVCVSCPMCIASVIYFNRFQQANIPLRNVFRLQHPRFLRYGAA
jgi:hypothetical protein